MYGILLICFDSSPKDEYCYGNMDCRLKLCSDNTYTITSLSPLRVEIQDDYPKDDIPDVVWSKGSFTQSGDTIFCMDNNGLKWCSFVKKGCGDVYSLTDLHGFRYMDNKTNMQRLTLAGYKTMTIAHDLLTANPNFYLAYHSVESDGVMTVTELYTWSDGVKHQILNQGVAIANNKAWDKNIFCDFIKFCHDKFMLFFIV